MSELAPRPWTKGPESPVDNLAIPLGGTIWWIRDAKRLTQRAAAEALGISAVYLCNLERDKARPSARLLDKMRDVWGVDVYVLAWCEHCDSSQLPAKVRDLPWQIRWALRHAIQKQEPPR